MDLDLCHFGWDGCTVPADLKNICAHMPTWRNIKTLRAPIATEGRDLFFPWRYIKNVEKEQCMPCYCLGAITDDGSYAHIYRGRRAIYKPSTDRITGSVEMVKTEPFQEICIKEIKLNITPDEESIVDAAERQACYVSEINAILYEAFIHAIVQKTLEREGLVAVVPHLFELVGTTKTNEPPRAPTDFDGIWLSMEFLNGQTLERYLQKNLVAVSNTSSPSLTQKIAIQKNEELLLDVLMQLAFFLDFLQSRLRFNHRDLKIDNIFVRHHLSTDDWSRRLPIPADAVPATARGAKGEMRRAAATWVCRRDIVMLDFGFACVACGKGFLRPRATLIGAGSWYKSEDDCMKHGRDLAMFLYSLHCSFPLSVYISSELFGLFHQAMVAEIDGNRIDMCMGLDDHGVPAVGGALPARIVFNNGIYHFLNNPNLDVPHCRPSSFLREIYAYHVRAHEDAATAAT